MQRISQIIKQLDFFTHNQYLRYRGEENYRTVTGGILSIILIAIFIGLFSSLIMNTFKNTIINSQGKITYDVDPSLYQVKVDENSNFIFALGISNINLNNQLRYFDIQFSMISTVRNESGAFLTKVNIPLTPCVYDHWMRIGNNIGSSYQKMKLDQWLCPPQRTVLPLQGKYSSDLFKYSRIVITHCTNSSADNRSCVSQTDFQHYVSSNLGVITVNLYFVNTVINSNQQQYLGYYFQDQNYFKANINQGIEANIFFTEYSITTDNSILPWSKEVIDTGTFVQNIASKTVFPLDGYAVPVYSRIYFRKSAEIYAVERGFQKIDQTLSYIGGLFGITIILFAFLSIYSKFTYEIEFGDRIFKQNSKYSYGSQNFNFIVYMGYMIFYILRLFGVTLNWKIMKRYYECQSESRKQLDIHLIFKKITFFQEVSKLVLEQYHIKGLNMIQKPTIQEIKTSRKRYQIQSIMYHQLDRKGRNIFIENQEFNKRLKNFLNCQRISDTIKDIALQQNEVEQQISIISKSYLKLSQESERGDLYSQKIIGRLEIKELCAAIVNLTLKQQRMQSNNEEIQTNERILDQPLELYFVCRNKNPQKATQ